MKEHIRQILNNPHPGELWQKLMSPSDRGDLEVQIPIARNSSVMVLLYKKEESWFFSLIKRAQYNGVHSGQISLPGGKWEVCDADGWSAAVRETYEEIGICGSVEYLGDLTPLYIPYSNFMVYPYVGMYNGDPVFKTDAYEVADLIEVSLDDLVKQDYEHVRVLTIEHQNKTITAPYYDFSGHCVWGATAMILSEFREVIKLSLLNMQSIGSSHFYNAHNVQESPLRIDMAPRHDNNQILPPGH
ncbi:MAG: CoA pyrophosphatase [Marinilabiliaceae bacterium]|nr:CoA pyrophosphatase [Marinilabiliaceae bacterium]